MVAVSASSLMVCMLVLAAQISEHILRMPGWLHEHIVGTLGRQLLDVVEMTQ